jgi:hypothetical protein
MLNKVIGVMEGVLNVKQAVKYVNPRMIVHYVFLDIVY